MSQLTLYRFLKLGSAGLSILFGFAQVRFFTEFFPENAAYILTALSLYIYFSFFDFGLTKPVYIAIREDYLAGRRSELSVYILLSFILAILVVASSFALFLLLRVFFDQSPGILTVLLIALSFGLTFINLFVKAISEAIDLFISYEWADVSRKTVLLAATISVAFGLQEIEYFILFVFANALTVGIVLARINHVQRLSMVGFGMLLRSTKELGGQSWNNLVYTSASMLQNNSGFLLVPMIFSEIEVIVFQVWMKLYRGVSAIYRAIIDAQIPALTRIHARRDFVSLNDYFKRSGIFVSTLLLFAVLVFSLFDDLLVAILVPSLSGESRIGPMFWVALLLLLFGNAQQHLAVSFLLSVRDNFKFLRSVALGVASAIFVGTAVSFFFAS